MTKPQLTSNRSLITGELLARWEETFRAEAKADRFAVFRDHLEHIERQGNPSLLLEGTILFVRACIAYASMDNIEARFHEFLNMQSYKPARTTKARYAVTFDICGKAFARIMIDPEKYPLDFADLYEHPWEPYKGCGFTGCWISRVDFKKLTSKEVAQLEKMVTEDIRYDYGEDEVVLSFSLGDFEGTYLDVIIRDHEAEDDE